MQAPSEGIRSQERLFICFCLRFVFTDTEEVYSQNVFFFFSALEEQTKLHFIISVHRQNSKIGSVSDGKCAFQTFKTTKLSNYD